MSIDESRFGRVLVAYPDPRTTGWGGVIGGLVTLALGLGPIVAVASSGGPLAPAGIDADMIAGALCLGTWNLIGLAIFVSGVRDLTGKPEWQLREHGAVRLVGGRPKTVLMYRELGRPTIVERQRRGVTVGYEVRFDRETIPVPSQEVAARAASQWQTAQSSAPGR